MNLIEAIEQIDRAHFVLNKIYEDMEKHNSTMERMVNSACDIDKERKEAIISCLEQIIECKKFLSLDPSLDEVYLSNIKKLDL